MRSILDKLSSSLRLSSLVGKGMPERIRNFGFAFLGLTAAAGLALVVVFAQMGFPLLSPAPLPNAPSEPNSISDAVPLTQGSANRGIARAPRGVATPAPGSSNSQGDSNVADRRESGSGVDGAADPVSSSTPGNAPDASEPVETPPAVTSPEPDPPAAPAPAPATTPAPTPAPVEVPVSTPEPVTKPGKSTAVVDPGKGNSKPPKSEAKPAKTKPVKPPKTKPAKPAKPVNSEAKPPKTEVAPAPEPSYTPAPAPAPEGKDKLQETEETVRKGK